MKNYQYSLDGKGKKAICPNCHKKTFVLYINNETGEPLNSEVGKCDRANKCAFHYSPKDYFADNPSLSNNSLARSQRWHHTRMNTVNKTEPKPSYIDRSIFEKSLDGYDRNNFVQFLIDKVGAERTIEVVRKYFVGTMDSGRTIFWQIDYSRRIRAGKVMHYNAETGNRFGNIDWIHSILKLPNFNLKQCIFGEHLLTDTSKTVGIVESEKSAIIASIYLPDQIWLAVGSSTGLNIEKLQVLRGRSVILYPDLSEQKEGKKTCFEEWSEKAKEMRMFCKGVSVSNILERDATESDREEGLDIADYLLRLDIKDCEIPTEAPVYTEPKPIPQRETLPVFVPSTGWHSFNDINGEEKPKTGMIDIENEVKELKEFFDTTPLPTTPVQLNPWTTINDCAKFVESHLSMLRNPIPKTFLPYLERLQLFRDIVKNQQIT